MELGVVIGKNGRDIPKSEADGYIAGYGELFCFPAFTRVWEDEAEEKA